MAANAKPRSPRRTQDGNSPRQNPCPSKKYRQTQRIVNQTAENRCTVEDSTQRSIHRKYKSERKSIIIHSTPVIRQPLCPIKRQSSLKKSYKTTLCRARGAKVTLALTAAVGHKVHSPRIFQHKRHVFLVGIPVRRGLPRVLVPEVSVGRVVLEMQGLALHGVVRLWVVVLGMGLLIIAVSKGAEGPIADDGKGRYGCEEK